MAEDCRSSSELPLRDGSESDDCEVGDLDSRRGVASPGCTGRRSLWLTGLGVFALFALFAVGALRPSAGHGRLTGERLGLSRAANIVSLVLDPFDCAIGLDDWETDWSVAKKRWCCSNKELGCPGRNHVSLTFVVTNIKFKEITKADNKDVMEEVLLRIKADVAAHAENNVQPDHVSLAYWEGSGLHATQEVEGALGMVVRSRIEVPDENAVDAVIARFKQANFKSKVAQDVAGVAGIHDVSVPPISVQDLMIEQKIVDKCSCDFGWPQTGDGCPAYGGKVCKDCYPGHHLTSGQLCAENTCSCLNGYKATGELCAKHLSTKCSSCVLGYHMDSDAQTACLPNFCTCANGTGATGPACYMDQGQICSSCNEAFHVDHETQSCKVNECKCEFGAAASGMGCTKHDANICQACEVGFHLTQDNQCERNRCTCENGQAALGRLCDRDGANVCAYCDDGLHLHTDGTCGEKHCLCPHGTPATGDLCDTHRSTYCIQCDMGYHMNSKQCVNEGCACKDGVAAVGDDCPIAGASVCESCHPGFTLINGACEANECTCENGDAAVGAQCRTAGAHSCGTCDDGYRHQLKTVYDSAGAKLTIVCVENVCTCKHNDNPVGIPAAPNTTVKCHTNGGNICSECTKFGYHIGKSQANNGDLLGHQCLQNQCKCTGGVPVEAKKCPTDGMEFCEKCNSGYFKTTEALTEYEKGLGSVPPTESKYTNDAMICVSDTFTTTLPFECSATQKNWETAWSRTKKHWCCKELGIGCVPTATEKELCVNDAFNKAQCELVGCCKWDPVHTKCTPADGTGERVCHPEFNIKISSGKCLTATPSATGGDAAVSLEECDFKNSGQDWSPMPSSQIQDLDGMCLHLEADELKGKLTVRACSESTPVDDAQYFVRDSTTFQLRSKKGFCVSAEGDAVFLGECQATNPNQQWVVPAVNR